MLRQLEILGLRAIRHAHVDLRPFQVLVGPNASGKSTLLDALLLVRDLLTVGLERAFHGDARFEIPRRVADPRDITWLREGKPLEIALTVELPPTLRSSTQTHARYEVGIDTSGTLSFTAETLWLCRNGLAVPAHALQRTLFPMARPVPAHIVTLPNKQAAPTWRKVVFKNPASGNDTFSAENGRWSNPFKIGPDRSALANLPADEERFPAALWVRNLLLQGVLRIQLNAERMRQPSPAGSPRTFLADGSNLPWVVFDLESSDPIRLERWIEHVRTALPDLKSITTRDREEDRARYIELTYANGLHAPSWVLSDGTLRLLALTLLAYIPSESRILLIEEPENGIHPRAIETVLQSLQSVYDGQVFVATHSPLVLSKIADEDLLCFAKDDLGAVDVVRGTDHPRLQAWRSSLNLGDLFAAGILG
jgi:ABC-type Mn2+/Zn2+ transport system ATPase subunit